MSDFKKEISDRVDLYASDRNLIGSASLFMEASIGPKYSYNFSWQGRPIIQYPQDIIAMQEIIWDVKPDLIIETGIAHGGSLIFSASILAQLDLCEAIENKEVISPSFSKRKVLGIDVDIRAHNKAAIENHPMSSRIQMIEGSSIDPDIIKAVKDIASKYSRILVCLDSNHTHEHVLKELQAYAELTSIGSYCVVFDTLIEDMPDNSYPDRPWGRGNNPKTALKEFLNSHAEFYIDRGIHEKLLITVAKDGYLKRIK